MTTFYLSLAAIGVVILVAQVVLGAFGGDHIDLPDGADGVGHTPLAEGLELLSVRSLASMAAAFGLSGLALQAAGVPTIFNLPLAAGTGFAASLLVVRVQRAMLRLERDHVARPSEAIGKIATVHLSIPAGRSGLGKVTLELQGHFTELPARTSESSPIPSGTAVLVIDVSEDGVLDVSPASALIPE
jgi:hypothetical protein